MVANFTLATDPTVGRYLASLTRDSRTVTLTAEYLFKVWLFETGGTTTEYNSSTGWKIVESTASGVTTITATLIADTDIVVVLSATIETEGVAFRMVSAQGSATRAVYGVQFPNFQVTPAQLGSSATTLMLAHTYASGFVLPRPHTVGSATIANNQNMQFLSLFDTDTQDHLYCWSDDETFNPRIFGTAGNGTGVAFSYIHYADRRFEADVTWTRSYAVRLELFRGVAVDGRLGAYEAAMRYRVWSANAARPWRSRGLWKDAGIVSSFVKTLDFHVTLSGQQYASRWLSDLVKWKDDAGFVTPLFTLYSWKNPGDFAEVFDPEPIHGGAITATTKGVIDDFQADGWRVMLFGHPHLFDSRASNGWKYGNWTSTLGLPADLSAYMMKTKADAVRASTIADSSVAVYGAGTLSTWDFSVAQTDDIAIDVAVRYSAALAPSAPGAFYLDAFGPTMPATPSADPLGAGEASFQDATTATTWTHAAWMAGMQTYFDTVRAVLKLSDTPAFIMTEWPSEWSLPYVDVMFDHSNHSNIGAPAGLFQIVHGDAARFSSFGMSIVALNSVATSLTYVVTATYQWLRGGIFAYNDGLDIPTQTVFGAGALIDSELYYFVTWAMKLQAMNAVCLPYFKGHMTRPHLADWRPAMYANCTAAVDNWKDLIGTDSFFMTESWQKDDGDIGIIVLYAFPGENDFRPGDPVTILPAVTRTITVNSVSDGVASGTHFVYRTVNGGTRTKIGEFAQSISFSVTFDPWTVTLIEIETQSGGSDGNLFLLQPN